MPQRKLYLCYAVFKDEATGDLIGSARATLAESASAALQATADFIRRSAPEVAHLTEVTKDAREVPRELLEEAATEVLGWSKPNA